MPVRLATETDAAALIALDSVAEYEPQRAAQIRTWCAQSVCYLAEERGVVMGYGVLHYHFFGCGFIADAAAAVERRLCRQRPD